MNIRTGRNAWDIWDIQDSLGIVPFVIPASKRIQKKRERLREENDEIDINSHA